MRHLEYMIRYALIGCGRIGLRHAELLGRGEIVNSKLVAVCDVIKEKALDFKAKYAVAEFSTIEDLLVAKDCFDVAVIATESGNHAAHAKQVLLADRHVLIEKPMALRITDAEELINLAETRNLKLFVVKQNRFNVPIVKLKQALVERKLGKISLASVRVRWCRTPDYYSQAAWRGTWRLDGGVLANQAIHHIDLLEWLIGEVEFVYAISSTALAPTETEDTAVALVKFKEGTLATIEATTATRPRDLEGSISVLGEYGTIEIGGFAANEVKVWSLENEHFDFKEFSTNPPDVYGFGHKAVYESIQSDFKNKTSQGVTGADGLRSLKLLQALYQSIETGDRVYLNDLIGSSKLGEKQDA
jgi:UDP-N-acetyl-2-amino-2-deoxyglucuronate dehydrogenase